MIDINIYEEKWDDCLISSEKFINDVVAAIPGIQDSRVSILLTNDLHIQELNKKFRNQDKSTNVLSFPYQDFPDGTIGDVTLALETIQKEANDENISFKEHTAHMLIHGVLHLLGYTHDEDDEAEIMENLEGGILSKLRGKYF